MSEINSNKHKNYEILNLLGYGLSKFGNKFINKFGFSTKTEFYNEMVAYGIADTASVVKNRQDLFDPFFENGRKGWWQKGDTYKHRKTFIDSLFGNLDVDGYYKIIKMYLQDKFEYKKNEYFKVQPIIQSKFKKLQETGLEAEMYFLNNYNKLDIFYNGIIEDTRLLGDGYDFQIEVKKDYFLAEVKGVRNKKGSVRLTNNEYKKARQYQDKYILLIISNLNEIPKVTLIPNPIQNLGFDKNIIKQEQITYNTKNLEW